MKGNQNSKRLKSINKMDVELALKINKLVHNECKDAPHDIGVKIVKLMNQHNSELKNCFIPDVVGQSEQLIEIYDHYGASFFGKGDDKQLKEWGNSDERIREIKIECVKFKLNWYKDGIEIYRMLNEKCGGENVL